MILEGPATTKEDALKRTVECMMKPFEGENPMLVELAVDADTADTWYEAK